MSSEYIIAVLGIFAGLCAIVALVWAIRHRQLQIGDQAMYEAVDDDEPDFTESSSRRLVQASRRYQWLSVTAFASLVTLIVWLIVQTVHVATSASRVSPAAQQQSASK